MTDEEDLVLNRLTDFRDELQEYVDRIEQKIELRKQGEDAVQDLDERLLSVFLLHIDEQKVRLEEIGGFGVGGTEPDVTFPSNDDTHIDTWEKEKKMKLRRSVRNYWSDASMTYVRGNFRGCIFQSATMLEGGLKLKVYEEGMGEDLEDSLEDSDPTLGNLIDFFEKETDVLADGDLLEWVHRVNNLRINHIHLLREEDPEEALGSTDRDEFVTLDEFEGDPPVEIKDGWITGDGVNFRVSAEQGPGIVYKYKKDAKEALEASRNTLREIFEER